MGPEVQDLSPSNRHEGAALGRNQRRLDPVVAGQGAVDRDPAVLEDLAAVLGKREEDGPRAAGDEALVVDRGLARVALDVLVVFLRQGAAPARRVDVHLVAVVALDERDLPRGELVGVLVDVAGVDREQDLVILEEVGPLHPRLPARGRLGDATRPLGDGALGIAGPLRADGCELRSAETGDLLLGGDCEGGRRRKRQRDRERGGSPSGHCSSSCCNPMLRLTIPLAWRAPPARPSEAARHAERDEVPVDGTGEHCWRRPLRTSSCRTGRTARLPGNPR